MATGATLLAGRYELRHVLGAGPAGKVWAAFDHETGVRVAVKTFHGHLAEDPVFRATVQQAAQDAAQVEHGNLVAVRGAGDDGRFVVMDLVRGESMRALLDEHGPPSAEVAVELAYDACAALTAAHAHGVLHGNLKPENLLVVSGYARVTDLALPAVPDGGGPPALARYQAPEVARTGSADARSDLYALGCCLYELVVGRPPFDGPTARDVAVRHAAEPPALPSTVGIGLPAALEDVIERALAKDPDERYQTAQELRESLRQVALRLGAWHKAAQAEPAPPDPAAAGRSAPAPERPFTPAGDGPFAPAQPAPLRAPVSPLALMEADAASRPAPQPVAAGRAAAGRARPAPGVVLPSRRARAAQRDTVPMGVRILTALIVFGLLTGIMTGTVAATGTAGALQALVSPTAAAAGAAPAPEPEAASASQAVPGPVPAPEPEAQPQEAPVATGQASVEDLAALIDADAAAVGPRGVSFRDRLVALPTLSGEALRLELSYLRSVAAIGPANGDFTPAFSQAAVGVLDREIAAQPQP